MNYLLAGPRGRRLVFELAREADHRTGPGDAKSFARAAFDAAHWLDPGRGSTNLIAFAVVGSEVANAAIPRVEPAEVASRLQGVAEVDLSSAALNRALAAAVDRAMYWQEPDGTDALCASPEMLVALGPIAERVAAAAPEWWSAAADTRDQWAVTWDEDALPLVASPYEVLLAARTAAIAEDARAARERPADVQANWSGEWWSHPGAGLLWSARSLPGEAPAVVQFVEDGLGWQRAVAHRVGAPGRLRVYEIDSAAAWAQLCRQYPLDQTHQKRHDWYRATGADSAWVVPDWRAVARDWDGVHLQARAYLAAAGTMIPVDGERASVIAGWNPDSTYWFSPDLRPSGEVTRWRWSGDATTWIVENISQ